MKKRILAIGLGTVMTLAMLTGCGKNENLANTDFGTVTQEDIHQVAEEHHVDEGMLTEIVEELTEQQKLEREVTPFVMEVVANLIATDDNFVQDAEWIAANQVPVPYIDVTRDGVNYNYNPIEMDAEYYRNILSKYAEKYPGQAMGWRNGTPSSRPENVFPEKWDESSLKITEVNEAKHFIYNYNRFVQDGCLDESYQEVIPERVVEVTMECTGHHRNNPDNERTDKIEMTLVKINGTWYFEYVDFI